MTIRRHFYRIQSTCNGSWSVENQWRCLSLMEHAATLFPVWPGRSQNHLRTQAHNKLACVNPGFYYVNVFVFDLLHYILTKLLFIIAKRLTQLSCWVPVPTRERSVFFKRCVPKSESYVAMCAETHQGEGWEMQWSVLSPHSATNRRISKCPLCPFPQDLNDKVRPNCRYSQDFV